MTYYLVEFRFHGYAKRYAKHLIYDVAKKYRVRGVTKKRAVPHITLFGPFKTRYSRKAVAAIVEVAKQYTLVPFRVTGFDYFDNPGNKVIYLDIEPSKELRELRYNLAKKLNKITQGTLQDKHSKKQFRFQSTIAFKDIDHKFDRILSYIKTREEPNIHQHLIRITILRNSRILYEYDLLQKRLLTRRQALNKSLYLKTINLLKQKLKFFYICNKHNVFIV